MMGLLLFPIPLNKRNDENKCVKDTYEAKSKTKWSYCDLVTKNILEKFTVKLEEHNESGEKKKTT